MSKNREKKLNTYVKYTFLIMTNFKSKAMLLLYYNQINWYKPHSKVEENTNKSKAL